MGKLWATLLPRELSRHFFYSWGDSQSGNFHTKNDRALSKASCPLGLNYIIQVNFLGRCRFLLYSQGKNFPRAYYVTNI